MLSLDAMLRGSLAKSKIKKTSRTLTKVMVQTANSQWNISWAIFDIIKKADIILFLVFFLLHVC